MKTKKLNYRIGNLKFIEIPNDWRKAEGIKASKFETNMGLAQRDYSKKCKHGTEPLMVVEGFWLWWCYTHNQPAMFCEQRTLNLRIDYLEKNISEMREFLNALGGNSE